MNRSLPLILIGVAIAAAAAYFWLRSGREHVAVDLVSQFASAKRKQPSPEVFTQESATIGGVSHPAIETSQPSRITYNLTVPEKGMLKVSLGILEKGWTMEGDGVLFRIGVSTGGRYDELLSLVIDPFHNAGERSWRDLSIDLSEYAGENVDLIFNTNPGPPPSDNRNGDFAAWGAPRVVVQ